MAALLILLFITVQRLAELVIDQRHTRDLMLRGAIEAGRTHYPYMIALHSSWLIGLWWFAHAALINLPLILIYASLQIVRLYIIISLGSRWTTRIIILPDAPLVRRGPYRYVKHPNYILVVIEIALLPLAFGLYTFALVFSVLNFVMLAVRIKVENEALHYRKTGDGR